MTTIVYRKGRLMADTQVTYQGRFDDIFTNAFEKLGLKQKREDLKTSTSWVPQNPNVEILSEEKHSDESRYLQQ